MNKLVTLVLVSSALSFAACKQEMGDTAKKAEEMQQAATAEVKKEAAEATEKVAAAAQEATETATQKAAEATKEAVAAADGADSIGVGECDDYVSAMKACIAKMPEQAKEPSENALRQSVSSWKAAAGTEAGKAGLASACKSALDSVKANPACQ